LWKDNDDDDDVDDDADQQLYFVEKITVKF
jgi:hypothetical protein